MLNINQFIQEKLKVNSKTKINKNDNIKLTLDTEEYKGVKFIEQYKDHSKNDFRRYGSIPINLGYEIAQIIIDNCEEELQGYYFQLFYSGYSGFVLLSPDFDGENPDKYKEGIICFYAYADKTGYKVHFNDIKSTNASLRLKDFIGEDNEKFKL